MLKFLILSVLFFSIRSLPTHLGNTTQGLYENSQANPTKRILSTGCPSDSDFKYPNGSCLSSCPEPYKSESDEESAFCNPPCSEQYFDEAQSTCVASCEPAFIRADDNGILYCDASTRCPLLDQFKFPSSSCPPPTCLHPHLAELRDGVYYCNPPCSEGYFDVLNPRCIESCEAEYIRTEDDITYCDRRPSSSTGCPKPFNFKYQNGSCLPICPQPFLRDYSDGYFYCNLPCPASKFLDSLKGNCLNSCDPEFVRIDGDISYCDATKACPSVYQYKYADGSCLPSCPLPYVVRKYQKGGAFCDVPCPNGYYNSEKDNCVSSCDPEKAQKVGDILYCNKESEGGAFSGTVDVYLRYDLSLVKFNYQSYFVKYIALLTKFLDENSNSEINIVNIKEGSTIIESQFVLKAGSQDEVKSKTEALNKKLKDAAESEGLNLEGASLLNHSFNVVIPEENGGKSVKWIVIGVCVGVAVLAIVIGVCLVCRYKKKQRGVKAKEGKTDSIAEGLLGEEMKILEKKRKV